MAMLIRDMLHNVERSQKHKLELDCTLMLSLTKPAEMLCSLQLAAEVVHLALQILYHRGQLLKIHPDLLFQARHPVNTGNSVLSLCFS